MIGLMLEAGLVLETTGALLSWSLELCFPWSSAIIACIIVSAWSEYDPEAEALQNPERRAA